MIEKIDEEIFIACENKDFHKASMKFLTNCKNETDCQCKQKNLKDVSMCMISHLQYITLVEDKNFPTNIMESYVSWRASSQSKNQTQSNL